MEKKTSFVFYPTEFFSNVYNLKKNQIADLIIALCELNYYGKTIVKLSDLLKERLDTLQTTIEKNNAKYQEICAKRQASGSKGGSKRQAKSKQTESNNQANTQTPPPGESEKEKETESEHVYVNGNKYKDKGRETVHNSGFVGAPTVEEVAAYSAESGYAIDPVAFVRWNESRGWMNGKRYVAVDWRKAVRKWYCKENGLSYNELETMKEACHDVLAQIKGGVNEN